MSVFSHSLKAKNLYFHWKESRRKIMDGWILLSLGIVAIIVSHWIIPVLTLIAIGAGAILISMALAVILVNALSWRSFARNYKLGESFVPLNAVTQRLAKLPVVIVYNHDYPADAIAFFSTLHSYILPLSSSTNGRNAVEQMSDEIKRLLPYPWQAPTVLEAITNPSELEACIQKLPEECLSGAITNVLMEAAWRFAKATRYFPIFGQPLPQTSTLQATAGAKIKPIDSSKTNAPKKHSSRSTANSQRLIWPVFLILFLLIGAGVYYYASQTGPTNETTYLEEFQIWMALTIPMEYHNIIGLGLVEDSFETNITAKTKDKTPLYENVGGGQAITTVRAGIQFDVMQEEKKDGDYWYYIRKVGAMGWTKGSYLTFNHVLPANTSLSAKPYPHQKIFKSPDREVPFAVRRVYHFRNVTWWEIRTFTPFNDTAWLQKGDNQ